MDESMIEDHMGEYLVDLIAHRHRVNTLSLETLHIVH